MMKNRLLRLNSPIETKAVLICFPWAGATATGYKMLAKNFNTENILCYSIVFATGKDRPISVKQSTQVAVALIFQELQNLSDLPIYFLGHSYGGIVAFETIRKLENTSVKLNLQTLIVSSVCSPDRLTLLNEAKEDVFHLLSNERLLQKLQDIKGVTDNLDPEIARYLMPDIKSDFLAFETYLHDQDKATISSPILCFGAEKDLYVDCSQLIHWNKFSSCSFEFFIVPEAYHHYFGEREILKVLHEMLRPYF